MNRRILSLLAPAVLMFSTACVDLEVTNPNNPDVDRVLSTPEDVAAVASSAPNSWYLTATWFDPMMMLQVTADALSGNFGNFGMRFNNEQPRIPYNNNSAAGDGTVASTYWNGMYGALGVANDVLDKIDNDSFVLPGTNGTEIGLASALFTQAVVFADLATMFDRAFIVTPDLTAAPDLVPYTEVRDAALVSWDRLIALTAGATWDIPNATLPTHGTADLSAADLGRIANTMAARTLAYNARNGAENTAVDWARVLTYADQGITGTGLTDMNFDVLYDDNNWFSYIQLYGNYDSWTRVDQRLINRMAPNIPAVYTGTQPAPTSQDNRLVNANLPCTTNPTTCLAGITADYVYLNTVIGDPGRGIWMQSPFYHNRYRNRSFSISAALRVGLTPYVLAAENDLLIAEALARTGGDLTRAATLVNKTRVTRGGLAAVAADATALLAAIDYERDVELLNTGGFIHLVDGRRYERLQAGTIRHLPIPAAELEVLGLPVYTFGGVGLPDM